MDVNHNLKRLVGQRLSVAQKLSVLADYDDMCRSSNSFMASEEDLILIEFIKKLEADRLSWLPEKKEAEELVAKCREMDHKNTRIEATLDYSHRQYNKERRQTALIRRQIKALQTKINRIKDFVIREASNSQTISDSDSDKLVNYINHMDTITEEQSVDDISYDKPQ